MPRPAAKAPQPRKRANGWTSDRGPAAIAAVPEVLERPEGEPMIRGAIVLNNLHGFEEVVGADVVQRALASLPPAVRRETNAIVAAAWVRAALVDVVFGAIADASGRDPEEVFPEAIERGVHRTLDTVWRALMQLSSDAMLIRRTPSFYARTYNRGRLVAQRVDDGVAEAELFDWPDVSRPRLIAISAGIRAVMRVAGRERVRVAVERTPDGARFIATWRRRSRA